MRPKCGPPAYPFHMSPRPTEPTRCALCLQLRPLRISHIVPAFAGRYLKETSATGYLRGGTNPNLRRQDLAKVPLLCNDCEQRFSALEREFSISAFPAFQDDDFTELTYGEWMLRFAVSLSWRTLVTDRAELVRDLPQFSEIIDRTLEVWRIFLLGQRKHPGTEHHLFVFAGVPSRMPPEMHPKFLHYALRGIDATEAVSNRVLAVYVKLVRAIFYAPLVPRSPAGWKNTRIHVGNGRILGSSQTLAMRGFLEFMNSRTEEVYAVPISPAQSKKITETLLKDPERAIRSESFKVHSASERLLRET